MQAYDQKLGKFFSGKTAFNKLFLKNEVEPEVPESKFKTDVNQPKIAKFFKQITTLKKNPTTVLEAVIKAVNEKDQEIDNKIEKKNIFKISKVKNRKPKTEKKLPKYLVSGNPDLIQKTKERIEISKIKRKEKSNLKKGPVYKLKNALFHHLGILHNIMNALPDKKVKVFKDKNNAFGKLYKIKFK
jgi:hypothetical protein